MLRLMTRESTLVSFNLLISHLPTVNQHTVCAHQEIPHHAIQHVRFAIRWRREGFAALMYDGHESRLGGVRPLDG